MSISSLTKFIMSKHENQVEAKQWLNSPEGLEAQVMDKTLDIKQREQAKKLIQEEVDRMAKLRWEEALEQAGKETDDNNCKVLLAENILCDMLIAPPHWKHTGECINCGVVVLDSKPKELLNGCSWCHTNYSDLLVEARLYNE